MPVLLSLVFTHSAGGEFADAAQELVRLADLLEVCAELNVNQFGVMFALPGETPEAVLARWKKMYKVA